MASILMCAGVAGAQNIDPDGDGARYAYGENIGWIDARPGGDGGPGVQVHDFYLSGWMWSEDAGWIALSCLETGSCEPGYVVRNDGQGGLTGFAWSENKGWVDFAPPGAGVFIDPATGAFSGLAWSESSGWIDFGSSGSTPFGMRTSWSCVPPPAVPSQMPDLAVELEGSVPADIRVRLSWTAADGATGYDVVEGSLEGLLATGGDLASSVERCVEDNMPLLSSVPWAGDAESRFYLVRPLNCGGAGSYDSTGGGQAFPRDPGLSGASACP